MAPSAPQGKADLLGNVESEVSEISRLPPVLRLWFLVAAAVARELATSYLTGHVAVFYWEG